MSKAKILRNQLAASDMLIAPGAYDAIGAKLIEQAGFPLVYMTGAGTSASLGYPDYGLLTMSEMVEKAGILARSVQVPVICDADTGYGNELNMIRTVREFESRGVAGIHIEDQVMPKRCGHLDNKEIESLEKYVSKLRAAVDARQDPDFLIIAAAIGGAATGFGVGHGPGLGPDRPQHRVGAHGAGALFGVVGLQEQAALVGPEAVQGADDVLEVHAAVQGFGSILPRRGASASRHTT